MTLEVTVIQHYMLIMISKIVLQELPSCCPQIKRHNRYHPLTVQQDDIVCLNNAIHLAGPESVLQLPANALRKAEQEVKDYERDQCYHCHGDLPHSQNCKQGMSHH